MAKVASFAALAAIAPRAFAAEGDVIDFQIHQHYVSPRALGMGNAFVGLADDYSALFYNPAGLARLEEAEINAGIGGMVDSKLMKLKNDIDTASKSTGSGNDIQPMVDLLKANVGNVYGARVTLNGIWARPKWAFAIIPADLSMDMAIHQVGGYSLDLIVHQDTTMAYGRGWDVKWFAQDRLSMGVTGKAIYRAYVNKTLIAADIVNDPSFLRFQDAKEGFTFDIDYGVLYTPKISSDSWWRWTRPSFGATLRNVADYGFVSNFHLYDKNTQDGPAKLGRRLDLGSVWELPDWWVFKTRLLADLRDIGHENFTFQKGSHLGMEFNWRMYSMWRGGWRVGLNQGYFSAGFTGQLGPFMLDLATYAEELGPSDAPKSSRRYVAKASLDF
jgi:hypothetical protein